MESVHGLEAVDLQALGRWMSAQGFGRGPPANAIALGGGTQNILLKFEFSGRHFVLRRPPLHPRAESNAMIVREATVLAALAATDVPHPHLIASCTDPEVLGTAFYLMQPIDGFDATKTLPSLHANSAAVRPRMGFAYVEAIAALAKIDYEAVGLKHFERPAGFLERQAPRWKAQLEAYESHRGWPGHRRLPGLKEISLWLEAHRPSSFRPGIIHGDYHLANVMYRYDCGELAAIIDWELSTIGDPLLDLGWEVVNWPDDETLAYSSEVGPCAGFPTSAELVAHYGALTGCDLTNMTWYAVLACFKLGIILEGTYARSCAGLAPVDVGLRLHNRTIALFEKALQWC
jgi:aminoglycoside phosphotransferase (APT) family kinase protein